MRSVVLLKEDLAKFGCRSERILKKQLGFLLFSGHMWRLSQIWLQVREDNKKI